MNVCDGKMCEGKQEKGCRSDNGAGYVCTLSKDHEGDHIACGLLTHNIATWPQETTNEDT